MPPIFIHCGGVGKGDPDGPEQGGAELWLLRAQFQTLSAPYPMPRSSHYLLKFTQNVSTLKTG